MMVADATPETAMTSAIISKLLIVNLCIIYSFQQSAPEQTKAHKRLIESILCVLTSKTLIRLFWVSSDVALTAHVSTHVN
jgi:hypothetical protein